MKRKINPNWIDKDYGYETSQFNKNQKHFVALRRDIVTDWLMDGLITWALKNEVCLLDQGLIGDCAWPDGENCKACLEEMAIESKQFPLR